MGRALTFPGQGSQAVGMGRALAEAFPAAREVFEEVDDALAFRLSRLMAEGPAEDLNLTVNAQPALMAHSIAALRVLEREAGLDVADCMMLAGHSLGEYSALCAARALPLADTARLLRRRGEAMQAAVPAGEGAMAAVIGLDVEAVEAAIAATPGEGVLEIANDNGAGQVVVSGARARVEALAAGARERGAKLAKLLPVSAPFHCSLMAPAAEAMVPALAAAPFAHPVVDVVANVTARPGGGPDAIRDLLARQIAGRVRWRETLDAMAAAGVDRFVEIGTGKVLTGLARRTLPDARTIAVGEPADIDAWTTF